MAIRRVAVKHLLAVPIAGTFLASPLALAVASAARKTSPKSVPIAGTFTNAPGSFAGTLSLTGFANSGGQLVANGALSGTVTDAAGTVLATLTNQSVQLPAVVAQQSCTILDLTLGPLHLNLLGLVIDLNQVHLVITAQQGGGLLGDLLCAIANLLNTGGLLDALVGLLNQLVGAVSSPSALQTAVAGTSAVSGTFAGTATLNQVAAQSNQLVGQATLAGTVANGLNQTIGTVAGQAVTLSLQATGSCTILDLTLGPLDLNLLGLRIQLNQVHLVITAEQGPGNLLGNLLCGLANLLNSNAALSSIAQVLNQILALL